MSRASAGWRSFFAHAGGALVGLSLLASLGLSGGCGSAGNDGASSALDLGTDVLVTDLDRDGRPDIVALTHRFGNQPVRGRLQVLRQLAGGGFALADDIDFGCYPWSMTPADIDGDGFTDFVVVDVGSHNCSEAGSGDALYLLRQDPARPGHLLPPEKLLADVQAYQAAVADLNGDGAPDIAFGEVGHGGQRLLVLIQDRLQRGRFATPRAIDMPGSVSEIVAGDVDGDGRADLFALIYGASSGYTPNTWLALVMQRPDGTLAPPQLLSAQTGLNVQRLAIADADGDGRADLLAHFTPYSTDFAATLRVLLQGPVPLAWSAPVDTAIGGMLGVDGTAFADVDGDGRIDVVLAGSWPESGGPYAAPNIRSRVNVLLGAGGGQWRQVAAIDLGLQPDAVAIADLDADGRADLVLHDGRTLWLMRQSAALGFSAPQPLN